MQYDLIIIGAGPGGYTAAFEAQKYGLKVCVIDEKEAGGTCLNRGCIPTKTFVHTADLLRDVKGEHSALTAQASLNKEALLAKKETILNALRTGIEKGFKAGKTDFIHGHASVIDANHVRVNDEIHECRDLIIAAGSVPMILNVEGKDLKGVITSDDILEKLPACSKMVIIGGGVIGCEMAGIYEAFGTEVIIIEALDRLLPNLDSEAGRSLALAFKKRGIAVHTNSFLKKIEKTENGLKAIYEEKGAEKEEECGLLLMAAGRRAVTDLFEQDPPVTERGRFVIDENCLTSIPHIYAVGDCAGTYPQLAHTAEAMGVNAVHAIIGDDFCKDLSLIPSGVYVSPETASVGLSEKEAQDAGFAAFTAKANTLSNARSLIASNERGFVKLTVEKETGRLLGCVMMMERATDLIHEAEVMIHQKMSVKEALQLIHGHPTFSEVLLQALEAAEKKI